MFIRPISRQLPPSHDQLGFTLVELVFVFVIMGLVTAMALPRLREAEARQLVVSASDQLVLAHSLARSSAIHYGRVAELHIDTLGSRFWVAVDTNGNGVRDTVGFLRDMAADGVLTASNRTLLCFDARGIASSSGTCEAGDATVVFTRSGKADTVRVTTLGKVLR